MARYGTVFAGPVEKTMPHVKEKKMDVATAPGSLVTVNSSDEFVVHATANERGDFYILSENYITQDNTDTNIPADNTGLGYYPVDGCFFYVLVAAGQDVSEGDELTSNGDGTLKIAATGHEVLFYAEESYNNTTGSAQLILVRPGKGEAA